MFKDDNERLQAGVLPTDPAEGTILVSRPLVLLGPALLPDARERLRTEGLTLPELLEVKFPATVWIVEGLIQKDSTHCVFGPPNSGKTFLVIEMIMRALREGRRVTFYEAEGSGRDLQQRLRRALAAHEIEHPEYLRVFHNADIDLTTADGLASVYAHAKDHRPDLLVFDSLAAMAGDIDENDAASMIELSNALNRIKVDICALVALHHMTKEGWTGETPSLRTLRGHSSLPGRLDVAMAVLPVEDLTTELELVFDVFEVKRRDEPKTKRRRCTVAMPSAGEAAVLAMIEIDGGAVAADAAKKRASTIADQMVQSVRSSMPKGISTTELRSLVSGSNETKSFALRQLLDSRTLMRREAVKGERAGRLVLGDTVLAKASSAN